MTKCYTNSAFDPLSTSDLGQGAVIPADPTTQRLVLVIQDGTFGSDDLQRIHTCFFNHYWVLNWSSPT